MTTTSENNRWWHKLGGLPFAVFVLVACNAVYISLVAFTNIVDYQTNYAFVQNVLDMDTTNFGAAEGTDLDPDVIGRAITDPVLWNVSYIAIIIWESLAGLVLILSLFFWAKGLIKRQGAVADRYATARAVSSAGLLMIALLFFGGFIAVGGEWFEMWRSTSWNGEDPAFRNAVLAILTLVLIHSTSQAWVRNRHGEGPATGSIPKVTPPA